VSLKSAEFVGTENRFLDGRTSDPVVQVGLAPANLEPFTGTRWLVRPAPSASSSSVALECLGHIDGPRFLDGRTEDGTVGLASSTDEPFSGTRWEVADTDQPGVVTLRCLGESTKGLNARFLSADSLRGTLSLVGEDRGDSSTTRWFIADPQPVPIGGPGLTSAGSLRSPSLAFAAGGIGEPTFISMAWQDLEGRIAIMADVLGPQPVTVSLANRCMDRPALTRDSVTGTWFLAWTAMDQTVNVMSSDNGLVFSDWVRLPGRSMFSPAIAGVHGTPVVAWTDADTSELKMVNGLGSQVVTFTNGSSGSPETSFAAPALAFFSATDSGFPDEPLVIAWTGTNAEHQLNVSSSDFRGFPPNGTKTTLPSDGSVAATSDNGPSLAFKTGFDGSLMVMGWSGVFGSNYLNVVFTGDFRLFSDKATFDQASDMGIAVVDATRAADGDVFIAWTSDLGIHTAHSRDLPVRPT
jgi:hypothetical protein